MSQDKQVGSEPDQSPETVASDGTHLALALVHLTHAQTYLAQIEKHAKLPGPAAKARGLTEEAVQAIQELL